MTAERVDWAGIYPAAMTMFDATGSDADLAMFAELVDQPPRIERGILTLEDRPGIGAALLEDAPIRRPAGDFTATR